VRPLTKGSVKQPAKANLFPKSTLTIKLALSVPVLDDV
jgi:hypothetical protein